MFTLPKPHLIQPIRNNITSVHNNVLEGQVNYADVHAMHKAAHMHGITSEVQDLLDKLDAAVTQHHTTHAAAAPVHLDQDTVQDTVNIDQEIANLTQQMSLAPTKQHPRLVTQRTMRGMGGRMRT